MLYTKNGSYPAPLPHRIRLSDGTTRSDASTFTSEEIADAGYIPAEEMPIASKTEQVYWTADGWLVVDISEQVEQKARVNFKERCLAELEATDYKVIKSIELGEPLDTDYVAYRQALRDAYNAANDLSIPLPQMPVLIITTEEPVE